jgi:predicted metal-dependent HD superfamily phosphohydrolase
MRLNQEIYTHIMRQLDKLPATLTYHTKGHVLDVLEQAGQIARLEGITNEKELELLQLAILYHDIGFLYLYKGHEEASCEIARDELKTFGISTADIESICGLIMATRIPQTPKNKLEEIICDADLDYLGRDDFFPIAHSLFLEMKFYGYLEREEEWNRIQVSFLEQHHYFTITNQQRRAPKKQVHLNMIKMIVSSADH